MGGIGFSMEKKFGQVVNGLNLAGKHFNSPVGLPAICASGRSFSCARIADSTERAGQKINLQSLLAYLGVKLFQIGHH